MLHQFTTDHHNIFRHSDDSFDYDGYSQIPENLTGIKEHEHLSKIQESEEPTIEDDTRKHTEDPHLYSKVDCKLKQQHHSGRDIGDASHQYADGSNDRHLYTEVNIKNRVSNQTDSGMYEEAAAPGDDEYNDGNLYATVIRRKNTDKSTPPNSSKPIYQNSFGSADDKISTKQSIHHQNSFGSVNEGWQQRSKLSYLSQQQQDQKDYAKKEYEKEDDDDDGFIIDLDELLRQEGQEDENGDESKDKDYESSMNLGNDDQNSNKSSAQKSTNGKGYSLDNAVNSNNSSARNTSKDNEYSMTLGSGRSNNSSARNTTNNYTTSYSNNQLNDEPSQSNRIQLGESYYGDVSSTNNENTTRDASDVESRISRFGGVSKEAKSGETQSWKQMNLKRNSSALSSVNANDTSQNNVPSWTQGNILRRNSTASTYQDGSSEMSTYNPAKSALAKWKEKLNYSKDNSDNQPVKSSMSIWKEREALKMKGEEKPSPQPSSKFSSRFKKSNTNKPPKADSKFGPNTGTNNSFGKNENIITPKVSVKDMWKQRVDEQNNNNSSRIQRNNFSGENITSDTSKTQNSAAGRFNNNIRSSIRSITNRGNTSNTSSSARNSNNSINPSGSIKSNYGRDNTTSDNETYSSVRASLSSSSTWDRLNDNQSTSVDEGNLTNGGVGTGVGEKTVDMSEEEESIEAMFDLGDNDNTMITGDYVGSTEDESFADILRKQMMF